MLRRLELIGAIVRQDLASLNSDWANTKGPVAQRAPTCHRVGGTATVITDIDTSLGNLTTSTVAGDKAGTERESDNGALEVDTLEFLFDCPPGDIGASAPGHGIGAPCTASDKSACDPGQVCDTAWDPTHGATTQRGTTTRAATA